MVLTYVMPTKQAILDTRALAPAGSRIHNIKDNLSRGDTSEEIGPDKIMQLGLGFWGAKTLLSAVELGVFTELAKGPMDVESLRACLNLHPRGARDFFDVLVALGMLQRTDGHYSNTPETDLFLDRAKPSYIGGLLEMANTRLYPSWADPHRCGTRRLSRRRACHGAARVGQRPHPGDGGGQRHRRDVHP